MGGKRVRRGTEMSRDEDGKERWKHFVGGKRVQRGGEISRDEERRHTLTPISAPHIQKGFERMTS